MGRLGGRIAVFTMGKGRENGDGNEEVVHSAVGRVSFEIRVDEMGRLERIGGM